MNTVKQLETFPPEPSQDRSGKGLLRSFQFQRGSNTGQPVGNCSQVSLLSIDPSETLEAVSLEIKVECVCVCVCRISHL